MPVPSGTLEQATRLEGAFGLSLAYHPEYAGAERRKLGATPGLFLRYGRFTLTNASDFATRRSDDLAAGLGVDMVRSEKLRVALSLRLDSGRSEGSAAAFKGLGNVRSTLRLRTAASWQIDGPWRAGAAWSADLLGRGGGDTFDVSAGWARLLTKQTTLTVGGQLGLGSRRYMQTYFGISADQASRSAYPVYQPQAGLREGSLFIKLRRDIAREWIMVGSASASRLLGPAAASPITRTPNGWALNAGLARQF